MRRTSRQIRVDNRFSVLRQVLVADGATRRDIVERTGLSLATVATLVTELISAEVLVEVGRQGSDGGRPRAVLGPNLGGPVLLGVDVAETYLHVDLFDTAFRVGTGVREEVRAGDRDPVGVVAAVAGAVRGVLQRAGVHGRDVLGVGVSVPGQVDPAGGVSVFAPNWSWHEVPLRRLLAAELDLPLFLDNPLKAIAVAEMWFGAGRSVDDLAVVDLGTGVGVGLALGGTLYRGPANGAGEWGHSLLALDGRPCRCGRSGCIEAYVGARGVMETWRETDADGAAAVGNDQTRALHEIARRAGRGDPAAVAAVSRTARYLGAGLADLINVLNPGAVVVCGWVADVLGARLLDEAREVARGAALPTAFAATSITASGLAGNQVTLGAALLALEGFLHRLSPPEGRPGRPPGVVAASGGGVPS